MGEVDMDSQSDGFQKPNKYLKYLPNATYLNADADDFFRTVKDKLTLSILTLDIKQGAKFWVQQLSRYIKLYGIRFTKEDHIELVKLTFNVIVTPDQDISITNAFCGAFNRLLKCKRLLSPDDVTLPWKPVYQLWKSVYDSKADSYAQKFLPPYAEKMVSDFVKICRVYFGPESTQEMLNEWRPKHCPFDTAMSDAFELYSLFFSTAAPVDRHDKMFRLWFDEFMGLYTNLDGSGVAWESRLVSLFSRLAGHNIGLIDWEPHLPVIFTRILKSFGLPVGPSKYQMSHHDPSYEFSSCCLWAIAMITPTNSAMKHISQFIKTIEPFMHPSNFGWWQRSLHSAISKLCNMFVARIHLERYKKPSWDNYIPEDKKLTDAQITEFVEILKPVVFTGLFSKNGPQEMTTALHHLAFLRPEKVIPQHLENLYPALENLTEPHRLIATLTGTLGLARALMSNPKWYPEGRLHVIPILHHCLPGIDSNDNTKTMLTLQLIATFGTLVPFADCSSACLTRTDLEEVEAELCSQTAQFEDFVFMFIDRIISLVEGLSLDHHESAAARQKASFTESLIEMGVRNSSMSVCQHMSTALFKLAFEKVWNYMSNSVFEVITAGKLAAAFIYGFMRADPTITAPTVIPHCCQKIINLTENAEVVQDDRADNSLLWNLLLLSESIRLNGLCLLPYHQDISTVLDRTLHMTNSTGHQYACSIMERFMKSLGNIYPIDFGNNNLDTSQDDYLPIRDWGMSFDLKSLEVNWHVPSSESLSVLKSIFCHIVLKELNFLDSDTDLDREKLQRSLLIIGECIKGAGAYLPPLESDKYTIEEEGFVERYRCTVSGPLADFSIDIDGKNVRNRILETVRPLMERLLYLKKDSAKPLILIANIYRHVLLYFDIESEVISKRVKGLQSLEITLENPLLGHKSRIRSMHVEYAYTQLCRLLANQKKSNNFTKLHLAIYDDLMKLATSVYDEVQTSARVVLAKCFQLYGYSQRIVIPELCKLLITPPPEVSEEQFKGALGLVLNFEASFMQGGGNYQSLCVLKDLVVLRQIWPAIIQAQHSEKPTVQSLVDKIMKRIEQSFGTPALEFPVSDSSKQSAKLIRSMNEFDCSFSVAEAETKCKERSEKYDRLHGELVSELLRLVQHESLQWKHKEFAMEMLAFLQTAERKPSIKEIELFVKGLVDDSVSVRKLCTGTLIGMLYSLKRRYPHIYAPSSEFSGYQDIQYQSSNIPDTKEKWESGKFVEKTFWCCTTWPEKVPVSKIHLPPTYEELDEEERCIIDTFKNPEFAKKLFKYLALENKEKDRFSSVHYILFKCLARNYGTVILECCKEAVSGIQEGDHQTESSRQRCIAEFVAGLVRGSKYWSFDQMNDLYDWLLPLVKKCITNVSNETTQHWGTAFATCGEDRDPKKLYRLLQFLMDEVNVISDSLNNSTSLELSSKLYFLQGIQNQMEWKIPELNILITEFIQKQMASPFKAIRSRLGSVLCSCFACDVPYVQDDCWGNPKRETFLNTYLPIIKELEDVDESELQGADMTSLSLSQTSKSGAEPMEVDAKASTKNGLSSSPKKLLFKTTLSWLHSNFDRHTVYQRWTKEIVLLMPIICPHTANFSDPELKQLSMTAIKYMSKALLPGELIPVFVHAVKETIGLSSWHARLAALEILQSMIFLNQFTLMDHVQDVLDMVVHLLSDERMEVKLVAATTLSGGIQCNFFDVKNSSLMDHFKKLSMAKVKSKGCTNEKILQCLTGVLGLGAIVRAYPYDVPTFLPDILMILSNHVDDPQPIQKVVKEILSEFKRTHHDNWMDHRQKFTDDQLVVLTNLLVSPNYYA